MAALRRSASSDDLLSAPRRPLPDEGPRLTRSRSLPSVLGRWRDSSLKLFTRIFDPARRRSLPDRPKPQVIVLGSGGKGPKKEKPKDRRRRRSSWLPDPERRWPIQGW